MTEAATKRRARRVASDEAHSWARSLPLNNPYGKTVLRALTLYVNGEGCCFVSIDQLAEDTDLSGDTVRRRLVWLEQVGAIVRLPQWIDENGRRNGDGRGRRTTDEIRLLLDADLDAIGRNARGDEPVSSSDVHQISPSRQQGLTDGADHALENVSPPLGVGQPSHSCDHLISEPEPEISPQPPSGGSVDDGFSDFEKDWEEPILRQSLARQVWAALTPGERQAARKAARGYVAWRKGQRKAPNPLGAHLFLKEREAWERFAAFGGASSSGAPGQFAADSPEGRAIAVLYEIASLRGLFNSAIRRGNVVYFRGTMAPKLLTLAQMPPVAEWVKLSRQQAGAWNAFLREFIDDRVTRTQLREGDTAPDPWPPGVDGKRYTAGNPETLMTDQDASDFA